MKKLKENLDYVVIIILTIGAGFGIYAMSHTDYATYTGTGVVQSERKVGKLCKAEILKEDGVMEERQMGTRSVCDTFEVNDTVTFKNGRYQH